eukprot:IDg22575t1
METLRHFSTVADVAPPESTGACEDDGYSDEDDGISTMSDADDEDSNFDSPFRQIVTFATQKITTVCVVHRISGSSAARISTTTIILRSDCNIPMYRFLANCLPDTGGSRGLINMRRHHRLKRSVKLDRPRSPYSMSGAYAARELLNLIIVAKQRNIEQLSLPYYRDLKTGTNRRGRFLRKAVALKAKSAAEERVVPLSDAAAQPLSGLITPAVLTGQSARQGVLETNLI